VLEVIGPEPERKLQICLGQGAGLA